MEFAAQYPAEFLEWHKKSNSIITLSVQNEQELIKFCDKLSKRGIRFSEFREPDIGNELTAIAICPGPDIKKLCSCIPLAGRKTNSGAAERLARKFKIIQAMNNCEQRTGQNVLQHGQSVVEYMKDLIMFLKIPDYIPRFSWRLPQWLLADSQRLLAALPNDEVLFKYLLWHDCGKPFCRVIDESGRVHFPNHAKRSGEIFREIYPEQTDVAELIEQDMDIHLLSAEETEEFAKRKYAIALLLAGFAEIHSNAELFGGISSTSFKIKWKHLDKRGKKICSVLFNKN